MLSEQNFIEKAGNMEPYVCQQMRTLDFIITVSAMVLTVNFNINFSFLYEKQTRQGSERNCRGLSKSMRNGRYIGQGRKIIRPHGIALHICPIPRRTSGRTSGAFQNYGKGGWSIPYIKLECFKKICLYFYTQNFFSFEKSAAPPLSDPWY